MTDFLMQLGVVDYVMLGFMLIGLITGFISGMSKQVNKVLASAGGIIVAFTLLDPVSSFITFETFLRKEVVDIAVLLLLSIGASLLIRVVFDLIGKFVVLQFAYFVERVFGSILGGIRHIILFCFYTHLLLLWSPGMGVHYQENTVFGAAIANAGQAMIDKTAPVSEYIMSNYVGGEAQGTE